MTYTPTAKEFKAGLVFRVKSGRTDKEYMVVQIGYQVYARPNRANPSKKYLIWVYIAITPNPAFHYTRL
jgi:hypothetical protein